MNRIETPIIIGPPHSYEEYIQKMQENQAYGGSKERRTFDRLAIRVRLEERYNR